MEKYEQTLRAIVVSMSLHKKQASLIWRHKNSENEAAAWTECTKIHWHEDLYIKPTVNPSSYQHTRGLLWDLLC